MDSVMDPLAVKSEQFTLEEDLDTKWAVLANSIVKEPTNTEEADAKVKEFKDTVKEKFPNTNIDDILTNKQGFRYLRSTNWDAVDAVDMFTTSVQQFRDFLPFVSAGLPSELGSVWSRKIVRVISKRDQWGRRVILFRLGKWDPKDFSVQELYTATFCLLQMISLESVTQVAGAVFLVDLQGFGCKHLKSLGVEELKCLGSFLSGGFPMWFRTLHIVNNPRLFNMLYSILKGFLGPRIKENVLFHGYQLAGLLDHLPPEVLPADIGGTCDDSDGDLSVEALIRNEALVLEHMEQLKQM